MAKSDKRAATGKNANYGRSHKLAWFSLGRRYQRNRIRGANPHWLVRAARCTPMKLTFHILRLLLGALAFYAAAFVREDEEGAVQDRLQEWWLKLMYKRDSALSKATIFMRGIARLANEAFDAFLGGKLWSLQAVGVSLWFSLASGCLTLLTFSHLPLAIPPTPVPWVYWLYTAAFACLGLLPYVVGRPLAFLTKKGAALAAP